MGEIRDYILVRNLKGERTLGRPKRRWKNNTKMDLQQGMCRCDWIFWLKIGIGGRLL
jgi:hypothetical protein